MVLCELGKNKCLFWNWDERMKDGRGTFIPPCPRMVSPMNLL